MLANALLKLHGFSADCSLLHSDNISTYLYISDFCNEFNGLWSTGFHLFRAFYPKAEPFNPIVKKTTSPLGSEIQYAKGTSANFCLLKNNQGLIISLQKPKVKLYSKSQVFVLDIQRKFEIISHNENHIILKYSKFDREGFGFNEIFLGISITNGEIFDYFNSNDTQIEFTIKTQNRSSENRFQSELLFNYHTDIEILRKLMLQNVTNTDKLKKNHLQNTFLPLKYINTNIENSYFNKGLTWAVISASNFVMQKTGYTGIWAGFHWFDNNWGRDTFISLPGISLVSGRYEEASHIIETFIHRICKNEKSNDYGKIPNVVFNNENIIYNTSDATPLLLREIYEYYLYSGDSKSISNILKDIIFVIDNVYINHKDENNFLKQPDSDDWMDAKLDGMYPLSPRGNKSVEIQSLWYTALNVVSIIINDLTANISYFDENDRQMFKQKLSLYLQESNKLKDSIKKYFTTNEAPFIYDHINEDGSPDTQIRPNGLLAIHYTTLPNVPQLFDDDTAINYLRFIHDKLIYKHGVCTLDKKDDAFHARHIDEHYHKDTAYHNGCNWLWLSGAYITVACKYGLQNVAFKHSQSLTEQLLTMGCLGTLSELNDPLLENGKIKMGGTYSQAWSVAEYCRGFFQCYLGIRPDVPNRKLYFEPNIPQELGSVKATLRYGYHESISVYARASTKSSRLSYIEVCAKCINAPITVICKIKTANKGHLHEYVECEFTLNQNEDLIKITLVNTSTDNAKIHEITNMNNCELKNLTTKQISYNKINATDFVFAPELTKEEVVSLKTQTIKDYYEQIARKNKPTTITK